MRAVAWKCVALVVLIVGIAPLLHSKPIRSAGSYTSAERANLSQYIHRYVAKPAKRRR